MAWNLDIWHIDVRGSGDSTLIRAYETGVVGPRRRAALIDGGLRGNAARVHARIVAEGVNPLHVMVATHYDQDHMGGLISLLNMADARYANTRIYDQGEGGIVRVGVKKRKGAAAAVGAVTIEDREDRYTAYVNAIASRGVRTRATEDVLSRQAIDNNLQQAGFTDPDTLVGTEVLWNGVARPAGSPTLTCIAANQYILQPDGSHTLVSSSTLDGERKKNAKSLAFLLQFNNFKYYVGGDLEATQEDGSAWNGVNYAVTQNQRNSSLMRYLNQTNDAAGRVHAMKASHHGSQYSSSPAFIARLRPRAVFISCGTDNQYGHPEQTVVNTLQADNNVGRYHMTGEAIGGGANLTAKAEVAGVWVPATNAPTADGDIQLRITAAGSQANPVTFQVLFNQSDAGSNINKNPAFAYVPWANYTVTY